MRTQYRIGLVVGGMFWGTATIGQQAPVRMVDNPEQSSVSVIIGPVDLPAMGEHHHDSGSAEPPGEHHAVYPPIGTVSFPIGMHLYGFSYDVVDSAGRALPRVLVHHI